MALTLQKKLELAGDLAKVQPLLQRLHIVEKPKRRSRGRNVILVSSVIGAVTAAVVVVGMLRRRRRLDSPVAGDNDSWQADFPTEEALEPLGDPGDALAPLADVLG